MISLRYCLTAMLQINNYLCLSCTQTRTRLEIINALNLSLYSYVKSISKLGLQKTRLRINQSIYLYPVALVSLATFVFIYSRKSRLVRILKTHSTDLIRTCKLQSSCVHLQRCLYKVCCQLIFLVVGMFKV